MDQKKGKHTILTPAEEYFDKGLKNVIDSFEKAKEWADLSNCLQKVKKQIDLYKGLSIPRQRDLAKRLAQCLNPEINVIHQLTLEVYKEVFEREIELMEKDQQKGIGQYDRKSSIALFFSGLFNFYQFAAFEVKQNFLDLIKQYLLKMKKELILSLPGFMLCMLPALEDQNGEILKKVEGILMETEKIVGTSEFYGEIWKAMLRTPRARLSAIKYLDRRIPKHLRQACDFRDKSMIHISDYTIKIINSEVFLSKDQQKLEQEMKMRANMELHDFFYFYYPNKNKLVVNAILQGLSIVEPQVYVNRGTLDFLISHMPINSDINTIDENIRLVECATLAYTKKDFATLNKISNWLFGHLDEDEEEIDPQDPTIITIVESQKNLFRKSMDVKLSGQSTQIKFEQSGAAQMNNIDKLINNPILILLRILSDEANTTVPILKHLSIHLIKFIRFHLVNKNADINRFKANLINLLEQIAPHYRAVLESLAAKLKQEIENLDYNVSAVQETVNLESIDLISFAIFDMQQLYRRLLQSSDAKLYLTQILSNLLNGMDKISNEHKNLEMILPSLEVIDQILNILQKLDDGQTLYRQKRQANFRASIESFNTLYMKMSMKMIEDCENPEEGHYVLKQELDTYKKYNNIMLKVLPYQNVDAAAKALPEWLDMLITASKASYPKICLVAVDIFIKILSIDCRPNSKGYEQGTEVLLHIQRLIADPKNIQGRFTDKLCKNPQAFKKEFLQLLQYQEAGDEKSGKDHCKEIVQNLWSILDQEIDTENIVTHLREFDKLVPRIFSDVVIEELRDKEDRGKQDRAIKKFTTFWKYTAPYYPQYKPFETDINGKKYLALHNMINFLEDPDPTLRLSCRSWLSQSKLYNRILDPLIEEFIKNSNFKISDDFVLVDGQFQTQYVIENFGKLRNIILNAQDDILEYMIVRVGQQHILQLYTQKFSQKQQQQQQPMLESRKSFVDKNDNQIMSGPELTHQHSLHHRHIPHLEQRLYLDILVEITLRFIRAEYPQEKARIQGSTLQENQMAEALTVNASACEFMELILKQLEKYAYFSNKIAHVIINPLIDTFYHVIRKKNYAMQVNIINLLGLILNECNFQGNKADERGNKESIEDSRTKCATIFKHSRLIDAIILGLKSDVSFVRQKFIRFVEMFVPYLRKFTKENESFKDEFKKQIERLLDCFCDLLERVDVSFFSNSRKPGQYSSAAKAEGSISQVRGESATRATMPSKGKGRSSLGEIQEQNDSSLENLVINQESDIVPIIGGLQCIINTCLGLDATVDGQSADEDMEEGELDEEEQMRIGRLSKHDANKKGGFLGGLFGGGENNYFAPDVFAEVKKVIYEKLKRVFISCIYCWNHFELFNWNEYHFTRYGQFGYYPEDNRRILEKLRLKRSRLNRYHDSYKLDQLEAMRARGGEPDKYLTLDENLQHFTNPIQKKILGLLRPIAKKIPDQFIEGALSVWLRKSLLGQMDISRSYQKIIQMIICVYSANENHRNNKIEFTLPIYQVIQSVIKFIQQQNNKPKEEQLVNTQRWTKNNPPLSPHQTSSETLLNSFLFSYLLYHPSMFDPLFETRSEEKTREYQKTYISLIKYFNVFKLSRNPFTICWQLEILNLVTLKFNLQESKLDNRMKKEYHELFNNILTNFASILTDTFNIKFHEMQGYTLAFPPTVYEMLWRYEYISFKSSINDDQAQVSHIANSGVKNASKMDSSPFRFDDKKAKMDVIQSSGPLFFDKAQLKSMVDYKFEYRHMGGSSGTDASIFKNMEVLMKSRSQLSSDHILHSNFMEQLKLAIRGETTPDDMLVHTKFFSIITLNQILCQLLVNLVGTGDTEKTNKSMQIILGVTIRLLQEDNKQVRDVRRPLDAPVMNQFVTEFFGSLVERSHQIDPGLIKPYRREIIDLFNADTFFQQSILNLKQWQKIMKYFIDGKPDEIFEEQMQKWNFTGGLFASNATVIAQKCYAMKRIAFLIFSCDDDDFQGQLDQLMKKMIEVFKQKQKSDLKQRLFLCFLTRVMLIRLNFHTLTEALRKLWPHLLNELISIFEVKQGEALDQENTDLTIEAIKLVQLLSSLNIEDFQMNQWIFLIDGYGMKLEQSEDISLRSGSADSKKPRSNKLQELRKQTDNTEVFKTIIVRFIGNQQYSFYNVEPPSEGTQGPFDFDSEDARNFISVGGSSSEISASPQSQQIPQEGEKWTTKSMEDPSETKDNSLISKFHIVNKPDFDSKLQEQACSLQQSINDSNVIGNEFNRQEAEAKIEIDFIENDRLI